MKKVIIYIMLDKYIFIKTVHKVISSQNSPEKNVLHRCGSSFMRFMKDDIALFLTNCIFRFRHCLRWYLGLGSVWPYPVYFQSVFVFWRICRIQSSLFSLIRMVLILDGNSEHVAHAWRIVGLRFVTVLDLIKCLKQLN